MIYVIDARAKNGHIAERPRRFDRHQITLSEFGYFIDGFPELAESAHFYCTDAKRAIKINTKSGALSVQSVLEHYKRLDAYDRLCGK